MAKRRPPHLLGGRGWRSPVLVPPETASPKTAGIRGTRRRCRHHGRNRRSRPTRNKTPATALPSVCLRHAATLTRFGSSAVSSSPPSANAASSCARSRPQRPGAARRYTCPCRRLRSDDRGPRHRGARRCRSPRTGSRSRLSPAGGHDRRARGWRRPCRCRRVDRCPSLPPRSRRGGRRTRAHRSRGRSGSPADAVRPAGPSS